jgi:flagellar hook-associated protein 1 FlgK
MSIGFTTGLKALYAAQLSLETAGHNIANAHIEGYSRQNVLLETDFSLSIAGVGYLGTGVKINGITRTVDELLEARLQKQNRSLGRLKEEASLLGQIEDLFNEPSEGGLSALFSKFFSSLNEMSLDPADPTTRSDVVMTGRLLTEGFNVLSNRLNGFRNDLEMEIANKIEKVNQLAEEIFEVTKKINTAVSSNMEANELYDKRNQLIKELNHLVDVDVQHNDNKRVTILLDGRILASDSLANQIEMSKTASGDVNFHMKNDPTVLNINDGELKALADEHQSRVPDLLAKLDTLAGQLAFAFNRIHATGIPLSGPFSMLKAENGVSDLDGDGILGNELLRESDLAFKPEAGSLFVTVTRSDTGEMERTEIQIDPDEQSLQDVADRIASVTHLNAFVDSRGRLAISADEGYAFDFSTRLNPAPDGENTFGSSAATIVGSAEFPVTLNAGDTLLINENGINLPPVTFGGGTYTAEEIAAEINGQTGLELASVQDGRLVIQSITPPLPGNVSTLQITDGVGNPTAALGLSTALESGSEMNVTVALDGSYTGETNTRWTFQASGTGTIGVTEDLTVSVYNESGDLLALLDVGAGYAPGDLIEVEDGVKVSFSSGDISEEAGDFFTTTLIADSDTGGLLASLGLNSFFTGSTAGDLSIREDLLESPEGIAAAQSVNPGDNANLLKLIALEQQALTGLNHYSVGDFYASAVGQLGLEKGRADDLYEIQELVMTNLENQRASVSGVSVNEELLNLEKYQQMLEAATRYLQVMNEVTQVLMSI